MVETKTLEEVGVSVRLSREIRDSQHREEQGVWTRFTTRRLHIDMDFEQAPNVKVLSSTLVMLVNHPLGFAVGQSD
jgi:hypothetical protein